jgi:toxin CptA
MPIAVSAIVRPSRIHRCLLVGAGLALFAAALAVGVYAPARFHGAVLQACILAGAGAVLMHAGSARAKTHRIDISGTGDLVVTVQQGLRKRSLAGQPDAADDAAGVVLLPGSVVWPPLMLLRLRDDRARVHVLPVWRDSVEPGAWRALAVAVLALGRRGGSAAKCSDIR